MNIQGLMNQARKMLDPNAGRTKRNRHGQLRTSKAGAAPLQLKPSGKRTSSSAAAANSIDDSIANWLYAGAAIGILLLAIWLIPPSFRARMMQPVINLTFKGMVATNRALGFDGTPSAESYALVALLKRDPASLANSDSDDVQFFRDSYLLKTSLITPKRSDFNVEWIDIPGINRSVWISPPNVNPDGPVILYYHGGGYAIGTIETHWGGISEILLELNAKALLIDYRLGPEHYLPAGIEDGRLAYDWLVSDGGYDPKKVILMGDSAGGHLALSVAVQLVKEGKPLPLAVVGISPLVDPTLSLPSWVENEGKDGILSKQMVDKFIKWTFQNPKDKLKQSLLYTVSSSTLNGLPPVMLQVGTYDMLLDDSVHFARNATRAGAKNVKLDVYEAQIHDFTLFAGSAFETPEMRQAVKAIGEFIRSL